MSHWKASQVKIQVHLQKKFKIYSGIFKQFCNAILIFVWVLTKKDARSALLWSKFPIRLPRSVLKICEYFSSLFRYYLVNCWNKTLNRNKKLLWWKKIVVMISFVPFLYWIKHDGRHHFPHEYNVLTQSLLLKLRSFKKRYCHHKTLIKSLFMKPPSMWRKNMFSHKEGTYFFLPEFCPCHQLIPFYLQHLQCYPKCHIEVFELPQLRPQHIPKKIM